MTLREGRTELHDRLNAAAYEGRNGRKERGIGMAYWHRRELAALLAEARDAVLRCPHQDCAYCYTVEREVVGYLMQVDGREVTVAPEDVTVVVATPEGGDG